MHRAVFTGNGAYCYANALHMVLASEAPNGDDIPEPGFLEGATAMPFGQMFVASDPPMFWPRNLPRSSVHQRIGAS